MISSSPNIEAAKAEQARGRCAFCDRPLPRGRRIKCGGEACERAYLAAFLCDWRRAKSLARKALRSVPFRSVYALQKHGEQLQLVRVGRLRPPRPEAWVEQLIGSGR